MAIAELAPAVVAHRSFCESELRWPFFRDGRSEPPCSNAPDELSISKKVKILQVGFVIAEITAAGPASRLGEHYAWYIPIDQWL